MIFKLRDFEAITNKFSEEHKVGSGEYGDVYRGIYNGEDIALKKLHNSFLQGLNDKALYNKCRNLSKIHHENIVRLLGYSYESREKYVQHNRELLRAEEMARVLCFQYVQGGSLDKHISDEPCDLDWPTCYQIIKGMYEGLSYLYTSQTRRTFHLNLKPSNILLDKNMVPKIADLGLSRLVTATETRGTEIVRRTNGYMPPEYVRMGVISSKFDLFSLGVIIIKMMAGNTGYLCLNEIPPKQFIEQMIQFWKGRMQGMSKLWQDINIRRVKLCVEIALSCVEDDPERRPHITDIGPLWLRFSENCLFENQDFQITQRFRELSVSEDPTSRVEEISTELDMLERGEELSNLKLSLLQLITSNFSDELKVGFGGCGEVYKGILPNGNIAVKKLFNTHTIDDKMFHQEVTSMMMVRHENIVRLLGYCSHTEEKGLKIEGKFIMAQMRERLLCFKYMSNGRLEDHITDELRGLEGNKRYQIINGICDGLYHLHVKKHIIHMDLKPANILLDDNMVPKITDFGLSRLDDKTHTMSAIRLLSMGYCAPEYQYHGKMSAKSDIYSLGVIILEIVTGSKEILSNQKVLKKWRHRWNKTAVHTPLWYKQVTSCLKLALSCTHLEPRERPHISNIIHELKKLDVMGEETSNATYEFEYLGDMLGVDPLTIHLSVELNKPISCSIELTNSTDDYFAFRISTNSARRYDVHPSKDIVAPRSKSSVTITLHAMEIAPHHSYRKDEFSVQSTKVDGSLTITDISESLFNEKMGNEVDDVNLIIILGV